jgi:glycosyltransferase involved in cell wall biosynthesis
MEYLGTDVTVIIPTVGRKTLAESVESVLAQDLRVGQIIIVDDSSNSESLSIQTSDLIRVIKNSEKHGGNFARNLGISTCNTDLIMFLDDDDTWESQKVSTQIREINLQLKQNSVVNSSWISFSKLRLMRSDGKKTSRVIPHSDFSEFNHLESFLTLKTNFLHGPAVIAFSSLCVPRSLFETHPLDVNLQFHQDLTWILNLTRETQVHGIEVTKPLVNFRQGTGRVSSSPNFQSIEKWCGKYLLPFSKKSAGDYVLTYGLQTVRSGSRSSFLDMFKVLVWATINTKPSKYSYAYATAWILITFLRLDKIISRRLKW